MDAVASSVRPVGRDNGFFLGMAIAMAATVIGGFGSFAMRGMVNIPHVPFWVHVHGVVFLCWTLLFVAQNALVSRGSMALHRRLGWTTVGLSAAMVPLGVVTAVMAVRLGRVPFFFTPPIFLSLSALELGAFAVLMIAAVTLRRRTDWHKRMMLCAMIAIMGPAFGRILPMPLLGQMAGLAVLGSQLLFLAVAVGHDLATRRQMHPAYGCGAVVIIVEGMAVPLLGATAPFQMLAVALAPG